MSDARLGTLLELALHAIATQARDRVGRCDSAGVVLIDGRRVTGRGWTDEVARGLDDVQADRAEGPSVDALRFLQIFNIASIADSSAWSAFRSLAAAHGVLSGLSVPLCHGERPLGTINLYSRVRSGFRDCEQQAMVFASAAAREVAELIARCSDVVESASPWRVPLMASPWKDVGAGGD